MWESEFWENLIKKLVHSKICLQAKRKHQSNFKSNSYGFKLKKSHWHNFSYSTDKLTQN